MKLRAYQQEIVDAVRQEVIGGKKKIIMVLSTGAGKTAILFDISRRAVEKGGKVLLLVHRRDLAFQTVQKFKEYGLDAGLIMAGTEPDLDKPIQIASVWTYERRLRLNEKELNRFYVKASLILIDEAHRSLSKVFQNVMQNYQDKIVIGVTGTPCLSSGKGMGMVYESLVDKIPITQLIKQGFLVPAIYYSGTGVDTKGMKTKLGDWDIKELSKRSDTKKLIGDVTENWLHLASNRQTILFAVNRKHGKHLRDAFINKDIPTIYLDAHSTDEERTVALKQFNAKEIQVIVNVALFQEFLDAPITSCIDIARATKSMGLYRQMIGRGLRPYQNKKNCMVIDHGNCILGQKLGFIEDEIEWTLDGKKLAWKKKKPNKKEKVIMTCEECQNIFYGHRCPRCGLEVKGYAKKIATIDAKLTEITKRKNKKLRAKTPATIEEKSRFYGMLIHEHFLRGHKLGWIAHQYKRKFKVWPHGMEQATEQLPDQAFKNWLTYQRIKYFKGKEKRK